ncbi:hypothetical protein ES703_105456 [subsurface metagenome]
MRHQFEDLDAPLLSDSVDPISGLVLFGCVPPAIIMDHHRGSHQVYAYPSGLKAAHINSAVRVPVKSGNDLPTFPAGACECHIAHVKPLQELFYDSDHSEVLAVYDNFLVTVEAFRDKLLEELPFA